MDNNDGLNERENPYVYDVFRCDVWHVANRLLPRAVSREIRRQMAYFIANYRAFLASGETTIRFSEEFNAEIEEIIFDHLLSLIFVELDRLYEQRVENEVEHEVEMRLQDIVMAYLRRLVILSRSPDGRLLEINGVLYERVGREVSETANDDDNVPPIRNVEMSENESVGSDDSDATEPLEETDRYMLGRFYNLVDDA